MARKKTRGQDGPGLYELHEQRHTRRIRRQRALFIPRLVHEASINDQLKGAAQDQAYQIALRWADLESNGQLPQHKETSIDTQFLDQLFVEGLGYRLKTKSPEAWTLEHKFSVQGVGIVDGALGDFPNCKAPTAVIELKDALTDLDRDRVNGRTAVQQCWDYLNALPDCPWGIVSNFKSIRLYHREKGTFTYEEFTLQELRERSKFNEFYCVFERFGLLPSRLAPTSRALQLFKRTLERQKEVGNELYESYRWQRLLLIEHLNKRERKTLDTAIRIAQKLLDRLIFIAFCEDRELLREKCLKRASEEIAAFSQAVNPLWKNFLGLFAEVDRGGRNAGVDPPGFNGNLFKPDGELDNLDLDDHQWIEGFKNFGEYDFSEEVNVEVLGNLFERSITELEKLRVGGLYALKAAAESEKQAKNGGKLNGRKRNGTKTTPPDGESPLSKMPKSAQRKRFGIYYTPPAFTGLIVERTVDVVAKERFDALKQKHGIDPESREDQDRKKLHAYWLECLDALKAVTVCDPACGSGAFLVRTYDALDAHYKTVVHGLAGAGMAKEEVEQLEGSIPDLILSKNIFGVDLSHEAVEITQLALWIRSARKGKTLADLSKNILSGNSLVSDSAIDPKALDWQAAFPQIFGKEAAGGFTCVIGNPPWERIKVQEREFFSLTDPETAQSVSAADRRKRIAAMPRANGELHASYVEAQAKAQKMLDYARNSGRYPLTGKGDVNTYMLFAEMARSIVAPTGFVGLLLPSGIATDDTTKDYFNDIMDNKRLVSLYDFENRDKVFEDIDSRFKFSAMILCGAERTSEHTDFVFFAHSVEETGENSKQRHIPLTAKDMKVFNPNTRTCPIFRTRRDAELTKSIYKRVPILIDENRRQGGNPWGIKFFTMFHQTNDAEHFRERKHWERYKYKLEGNVFVRGKKRALPLYEAKMVQAFDHRAASVVVEDENWVRQGQKEEISSVEHQNPEFSVIPRWWVDEAAVATIVNPQPNWLLSYKDITSATNERTMIAAFLPYAAVVNSAPILFFEQVEPRRECCLLANFDSFAFDYVARQKVGSVHLNFFIVEQLPTLPPDQYEAKCPWAKRETLEHWISERVLKLSCTAEDITPLAKACDFKGSRGDGVHIWNEQERAEIRAELDAAYFHLYGIERDDVEYILSTFTNTGFMPRDERRAQETLWKPGSMGEVILEKYDEYAK